MKEIKFKYCKNTAQLWLLKVAFFFSVFAFSGFNEKIQDIYLESVRTELVETRNYSSAFKINNFPRGIGYITSTALLFDLKSYNYSWVLLNFNHSQIIKYRSISKKSLSYNFRFIKLPIKTFPSSSEDDLSLSSIG